MLNEVAMLIGLRGGVERAAFEVTSGLPGGLLGGRDFALAEPAKPCLDFFLCLAMLSASMVTREVTGWRGRRTVNES